MRKCEVCGAELEGIWIEVGECNACYTRDDDYVETEKEGSKQEAYRKRKTEERWLD